MSKSLAFGVVHVLTSFGVGYALTGSLVVAGALTLVEPLVNTVMHYFFDRAWESPRGRDWRRWVSASTRRGAGWRRARLPT